MTLPIPAPDCTALVTGASAGIGVELARALARRGHGVTLVARREDRLRTLAEELTSSTGVRAEVIVADVSDDAARSAIATTLRERGLQVQVLVNNAGVSTMGPVHLSEPQSEIAMIRLDVEAVAHLCSLFVPAMVARGTGAVLNVASVAAFQPLPGQAGYGGCKAFVLSYSQAMAEELRHHGVSVTAVCPGPVETEFAVASGMGEAEAAAAAEALPSFMWVSATEVALQALAALDKGRDVLIPGRPNHLAVVAARAVPRRVLLRLVARRHPALNRT